MRTRNKFKTIVAGGLVLGSMGLSTLFAADPNSNGDNNDQDPMDEKNILANIPPVDEAALAQKLATNDPLNKLKSEMDDYNSFKVDQDAWRLPARWELIQFKNDLSKGKNNTDNTGGESKQQCENAIREHRQIADDKRTSLGELVKERNGQIAEHCESRNKFLKEANFKPSVGLELKRSFNNWEEVAKYDRLLYADLVGLSLEESPQNTAAKSDLSLDEQMELANNNAKKFLDEGEFIHALFRDMLRKQNTTGGGAPAAVKSQVIATSGGGAGSGAVPSEVSRLVRGEGGAGSFGAAPGGSPRLVSGEGSAGSSVVTSSEVSRLTGGHGNAGSSGAAPSGISRLAGGQGGSSNETSNSSSRLVTSEGSAGLSGAAPSGSLRLSSTDQSSLGENDTESPIQNEIRPIMPSVFVLPPRSARTSQTADSSLVGASIGMLASMLGLGLRRRK